jgi:tripartite-type tricarboxylate transporter receptor subunit TctC
LTLLPFATAKDWPTKSITVNVGVAAGGTTDTGTRVIVNEMSNLLGVPILVVNMPAGSGGIAFDNTFRKPNDGYTWTSHGTPLRTCGVMDFHRSAPKDWYALPTVTQIGAFAVREDSPYKTFPDLIEALKKNPGKIPYAASTPSTFLRVAMEIMRISTDLSGRFVPYMGSVPSQVALLSGDVQFVLTGIGEQAPLLRGKKIRCLAAFSDKPYFLKDYGEIPAVSDFLPQIKPYLPFTGLTTIALRADTPKPILEKIDDALVKAMKTNAVKEWCEKFETSRMEMVGDEAQKFFQRQSALESWLLYEVGVAKINPADFGIPKP